jgi:hypothetical protein
VIVGAGKNEGNAFIRREGGNGKGVPAPQKKVPTPGFYRKRNGNSGPEWRVGVRAEKRAEIHY